MGKRKTILKKEREQERKQKNKGQREPFLWSGNVACS